MYLLLSLTVTNTDRTYHQRTHEGWLDTSLLRPGKKIHQKLYEQAFSPLHAAILGVKANAKSEGWELIHSWVGELETESVTPTTLTFIRIPHGSDDRKMFVLRLGGLPWQFDAASPYREVYLELRLVEELPPMRDPLAAANIYLSSAQWDNLRRVNGLDREECLDRGCQLLTDLYQTPNHPLRPEAARRLADVYYLAPYGRQDLDRAAMLYLFAARGLRRRHPEKAAECRLRAGCALLSLGRFDEARHIMEALAAELRDRRGLVELAAWQMTHPEGSVEEGMVLLSRLINEGVWQAFAFVVEGLAPSYEEGASMDYPDLSPYMQELMTWLQTYSEGPHTDALDAGAVLLWVDYLLGHERFFEADEGGYCPYRQLRWASLQGSPRSAYYLGRIAQSEAQRAAAASDESSATAWAGNLRATGTLKGQEGREGLKS